MRASVWILAAMLTGSAFGAATGRILDPDGAPIVGAEICEWVEGGTAHCVTTDAHGDYLMEKTSRPWLLVRAPGFVGMLLDPVPLNAPLKLARAAALLVTV